MNGKPIGRKNYGSIPHLPGSRIGPGDHHCHEGQDRIACLKIRDKHDEVLVQEKVDGANVGIARIGDQLVPLSRAGYRADTSPYAQHHAFAAWVMSDCSRFLSVLQDGERLVGEWMMVAHGTRYSLPHEPFVAFDLMRGEERTPYDEFLTRIESGHFTTPTLLHRGGSLSIDDAMTALGTNGHHGALDPAEGCVWRVERNEKVSPHSPERRRRVDFLVKYVRPDKVDGCYLDMPKPLENVWPGKAEARP